MLAITRTAICRFSSPKARHLVPFVKVSKFHACATRHDHRVHDPRLKDFGGVIQDEFAAIRTEYQAPRNPIILAHGLLGFDELRLDPSQLLPGIHYWRGITEALAAKNVEVITASVPPSGSIERRAEKLSESIARKADGKAVNIIAHSMVGVNDHIISRITIGPLLTPRNSGLDSRYMISRLKPKDINVLSLTTIATPHHGSAFADYLFKRIGPTNVPKLYRVLESFGIETGAFEQLTNRYMEESFNPRTPDSPDVKYFSYGAQLSPHLTSVFRKSHQVVQAAEGPNDGLVSVTSSQWGQYKGTLDNVSHLDLINWTNRLRWWFWELTGTRRSFNAIAFYLHITDMLAKEGL